MVDNKLMLWNAIYEDGTKMYEGQHDFSLINRDNLSYFILKGMDTEFIHEVDTGQTFINDNTIIFLLNDKLIGKSSDIINYKEKLKSINNPYTNINSDIIGYYTGWKEKNDEFDRIEVLYWVDMINQELKLRLTLTPKITEVLNSTFSMIINGRIETVNLTFPNINKRERFVFELFKNQ